MSDHLYRSRDDRMLAGVAGGLADMWDADPSLVRLIWALLVIFTGGIALIVYIVMAIVVPEGEAGPPHSATTPMSSAPGPDVTAAPGSTTSDGVPAAAGPATYWVPGSGGTRAERRAARRAARRQRGSPVAPAIFGAFLVLLGGFFLARQWLPDLDWDWFWPAMLIGLGVLLLVLAMGRRPNDPDETS